jgi:hypothetical protein
VFSLNRRNADAGCSEDGNRASTPLQRWMSHLPSDEPFYGIMEASILEDWVDPDYNEHAMEQSEAFATAGGSTKGPEAA